MSNYFRKSEELSKLEGKYATSGKFKKFFIKLKIKKLEKKEKVAPILASNLPYLTEERWVLFNTIQYSEDSGARLVNEGYVFKMGKSFFNKIIVGKINSASMVLRSYEHVTFPKNVTMYQLRLDGKVYKISFTGINVKDIEINYADALGAITYFITFEGLTFKLIEDITKEKEWEQMSKLRSGTIPTGLASRIFDK